MSTFSTADVRSLLSLTYRLLFLTVGLYMVLTGRLDLGVFDSLSKAVGMLTG